MLFVAITKRTIPNRFDASPFEQFGIGQFIATVVTDNFLSKLISKKGGFSVIESPLINENDRSGVVLSKVEYDEGSGVIDLFKSTMSGRPIYYYLDSKGGFYCSTHISMLKKAGVAIDENSEVIPELLIYRFVMPPQTLYKDIFQLVAGDRLSIRISNGKCRISGKYSYEPTAPSLSNCRFDVASRQSCMLLDKTIQALRPCKDRISVLLSGGLDSSILFKLCQKNYGINKTFSTGYCLKDAVHNIEKEYALSAAKAFGTKHQYYEVSIETYLNRLLECILIAEGPLHHLQSVAFYVLFDKEIPKAQNIVISGESADGIFGSYVNVSLLCAQKMMFKILGRFPFLRLVEFAHDLTGRGQRYANTCGFASRRSLPMSDPYNILWTSGVSGSEEWVCKYFNITREDIVKNRYEVLKRFEARSICDLISIAAFLGDGSVSQAIWSKLAESQEKIMYYPYSNVDVVDYIFTVPWHIKATNTKAVLRGVARQLEIPEFIIRRRKSGFQDKPKGWSRKGGMFEPLVPLAAKVFDEKQIRALQVREPRKAMTFWNILNYAIWKRLLINNEPLEVLQGELREELEREGVSAC